MNPDDYEFPADSREYVNEKTGELIVQYGRITAVFATANATDCKVYVGESPGERTILLTAAEDVFLTGMICHAQNGTYHERSTLWIAGDVHEVMNCTTVKEIRLRTEKVAQKWMHHRLQLAFKRRRL